MKYPPSPREDLVEELHGAPLADPYRWLEDIDSPQTQAWVQAQSELSAAYLAGIPARAAILQRIRELWDFEKCTVPAKFGGRYFYSRKEGLQNQYVLYWTPDLAEPPRLLLDPNKLSADGTAAMTGSAFSEDGSLLAYGISEAGSDWQTWRVRRVESGEDLPDRVEWVKFSGASWTLDGQGFFYSRYDAPEEGQALKSANYYHKLYYHRLGTEQAQDRLVYERPDQKEWGFESVVTEDGHYLIISIWLGTQRENGLFYLDWQDPQAGVVELLKDFDASYTFIGSQGSLFYFLTDLEAPLRRVVAIDVTNPGREHWRAIIPQSQDVLEGASLVGGKLIAVYLHHAHSQVKLFDLAGAPLGEVPLPGIGSAYGFGGKQADPETFFMFTNFSVPEEIYRYDVSSGQMELFRRPQLGFDPQEYQTTQVFYTSKDGTQVPMFLCHRKDVQPNAGTPTVLYGYGGFGISLTPSFAVGPLVWMEMGGLYVLANLRGGSEYGNAWHDAGRLHHKQNVFDDFIAAAEWLIAQGCTSQPKLAILGGSNGGLLVGACLAQRPDLFGACLPVVGVLDMLRYHKFTIGWAWASDFGSPDEAEYFPVLRAYSPYHNLHPGTAYPPTLITTGDHDDRVFPAHSFKFAAALQHAQAGEAPVLIRIEQRAGHGMGKPTEKIIAELADRWAFLVKNLEIER